MKDTCKRIRQLLDAQSMETALDRMASSVSEMIPAKDNVLVLGMASRGIPLAKKLAKRLSERYKVEIPAAVWTPPFIGMIFIIASRWLLRKCALRRCRHP